MNILPGSKIVGASGNTLVVDRLEGEILICGDRRIKPSAVVWVIPPEPTPPPAKISPPPPEAPAPLAVGETVYYCGDRYWQQYKDIPLILDLLREGLWICKKPDGYFTTNLSARELSREPVDRPKVKTDRRPQKGQWLLDWESDQRQKY
jgi:hypothetical protein